MDAASSRFDADAHAARMREQGYTVIEDFMDAGALAAFREALAPYMGTHHGRNDFEGFKTERIYTLVARGQVFEALAADARLMALIGRFLQPDFLLSASHAISLGPGETAQSIHSDDGFYRQPRPRPPIGISVIGAIDDFTKANGATEVIPGSHLWGEPGAAGRPNDMAEIEAMLVPMEIPAGAALVFPGTLLHRGGANVADRPRLALMLLCRSFIMAEPAPFFTTLGTGHPKLTSTKSAPCSSATCAPRAIISGSSPKS